MEETKTPLEGKVIDTTVKVKVKATKDAPFHSEGEITEVAPAVAKKMVDKKWGVIVQ
jgi:hypothetical protein